MKTVYDIITEYSASKKRKMLKMSQKMFLNNKRYDGIKSFAIFTSQNPMSQEVSQKENNSLIKDLKKELKRNKYVYISVDGFFDGNKESSVMVLNIRQDTAAYFNGKYNQTSFIYAEPDEEKIKFEYWEVEDDSVPYNSKSNKYIKKDEENKTIDGSNEIGFTVIGKGKHEIKVTVPFSVFGYVNEKLLENAEKYSKIRNCSVEHVFEWAINRVGMSAIPYRVNLNKDIVFDE